MDILAYFAPQKRSRRSISPSQGHMGHLPPEGTVAWKEIQLERAQDVKWYDMEHITIDNSPLVKSVAQLYREANGLPLEPWDVT